MSAHLFHTVFSTEFETVFHSFFYFILQIGANLNYCQIKVFYNYLD